MRHFTDALFEDFDVRPSKAELQKIANKIKAEADAHEEDGPYGNQNCMLCTWAVELQIRGEDFLPRPVISADDVIFDKGSYNFVKGGKKEKFESVDNLLNLIENGARYYCHVNWADSESGHEFLLVDDGACTYIVDGQAGKVVPLAEDEEYFKDINFDNSYIVRVDNKDLDREVLELNNIDQMSKSALEEDIQTQSKELYFISQDDLNGQTLEPRVPDNFFTKNGYEDGETPRVCFTPSVDQCLMAISQKCEGIEFYVFRPEEVPEENIYKPTTKEVPDAEITDETWITCPVKLKKVGKIKVLKDSGLDGHPFTYGDKTAELYDWDWEWLEEKTKYVLDEDGPNDNGQYYVTFWDKGEC